MISNEWDQSLKFISKMNPQSFVSLFLEGAEFLGERDKEFQSHTIHADLVYEVQWHGEKIILHVEFQSSRDGNMARRVWEYNVLVECTAQLPVYSVVLYLVRDGNAIEPPYERRLCTGELIHRFHFRNLKMWEMSASELRQPGMEGMLPLLMLTKDGAQRGMVDEVISDLARVDRQDLLPITYCVAALVFPENSENKQWLKERFKPMLNLFRESWAYQDMVAEGKKEGRQEGRKEGQLEGRQEGRKEGQLEGLQAVQEASMHYIKKRFPTLADQAQQEISVISELKHLQAVFNAVMDATTTTEVEAILGQISEES